MLELSSLVLLWQVFVLGSTDFLLIFLVLGDIISVFFWPTWICRPRLSLFLVNAVIVCWLVLLALVVDIDLLSVDFVLGGNRVIV